MRRVAVIGASGLVGSMLVERLLAAGSAMVVPFIHSSGNAMRLARRSIELRMLDLLDAAAVDAALADATHVVNCSRGGDDVMITGLKNLITAARRHRVERFVHLSSVAVYGDPPPPGSERENAPARPERGTYGWTKLKQDQLVMKAVDAGLPALILCPPNISGPYSYYLLNLVQSLRTRSFALLEDGTAPCNLVDVSNLCHAIELALSAGSADGSRMFVTDDEDVQWRDVIAHIMSLVPGARVPSIGRHQLSAPAARAASPAISLARSLKHLVSSDVREAMRKDPLWRQVDSLMRGTVARLGSGVENSMRLAIEGPTRVAKVEDRSYDSPLTRQQLRGVRHSSILAKERLGYRPVQSFEQSMEAFCRWYRAHHGMDTRAWPLLRELYPTGG